MEPLAELSDLLGMLDWELDEDEERVAEGVLALTSDLVRAHGKVSWGVGAGPTPTPVPVTARAITLAASKRHMVNLWGLTTSKAGNETLSWSEAGQAAGAPSLTEDEKRLLRALRGNSGGPGVQTHAWGQHVRPRRPVSQLGINDAAGYAPVAGGSPFPYYAGDEPW